MAIPEGTIICGSRWRRDGLFRRIEILLKQIVSRIIRTYRGSRCGEQFPHLWISYKLANLALSPQSRKMYELRFHLAKLILAGVAASQLFRQCLLIFFFIFPYCVCVATRWRSELHVSQQIRDLWYKFNEIVGYSTGINGQEWLPVWQRVTEFDRVPRGPFTRDRYHCWLPRTCGYSNLADPYHTRENVIKPVDRRNIYFIHATRTATFFWTSQIRRRRMNSRSFRKISYAICGNENKKLFVIRLIVGGW